MLQTQKTTAASQDARRDAAVWTWPSLAIYGAIFGLFVILVLRAFTVSGPTGWAVGWAYIGYDTLLLVFTFWQTLPLRHGPLRHGPLRNGPSRNGPSHPGPSRAIIDANVMTELPSLGVIVAAFNEGLVLEATVRALVAQSDPPDEIIVADDGSTDNTAAVMLAAFGLSPPMTGILSEASALAPGLRWLRLPHGGKATALNAALAMLRSEVLVTVDADTRLEPDALLAMRRAFGAEPGLVAATGILHPICGKGLSARILESFQAYEYMRSFLFRYAWMSQNSLLLVSGAFAGYRRLAVNDVGGFDPGSMVEDYDVMNRLLRYGSDFGLGWKSAVVGGAVATTSAPATPMAFMRQRRRWFGGFLQTQYRFRAMVGDHHYGRLGVLMLPITAIESLHALYGLFAFGLLLTYLATGSWSVLVPVGGLIIAKVCADIAFQAWSVHIYRRWLNRPTGLSPIFAIVSSLLEPFSFQLLRNSAAAWGWAFMLSGKADWGVQHRRTQG